MEQIIKIIRTDRTTGKREIVARFYESSRKEAELTQDTLRYVSYVSQGTVESNAYYQQFTYTIE